ncbi:hypothetical protein G6F54_013881 [Rhizopus delemar]|nr:hypothetical protein G6F54_013881 [Rhizopus delemar]
MPCCGTHSGNTGTSAPRASSSLIIIRGSINTPTPATAAARSAIMSSLTRRGRWCTLACTPPGPVYSQTCCWLGDARSTLGIVARSAGTCGVPS